MVPRDHFLSEKELAALVGPRTREVVQAFLEHGPMTVAQLQDVLGMASKTLYYQVSKLVRAGLLTASDTDPAVYQAIAKNLRMPPGYQGARYEELAAKAVEAAVRKVIRNFKETAERAPQNPELVDNLYYQTGSLRLTPESRAEFQRELRDLFARFSHGDGDRVSVVFVQAPKLD